MAGGGAGAAGRGGWKLWIETCAAARSAMCRNARPAGDSGSAVTIGAPVSPPTRIGA